MSDPANNTLVLHALVEARERRRPCALATVVAFKGSTPRKAGAKMLVYDDGESVGTIGGGSLEHAVIAFARDSVNADGPQLFERHLTKDLGMCCGGAVSVLVEPQTYSPRLLLFGAGHVAQPLAQIAALADFEVIVIDDREDLATQERFPTASRILVEHPRDVIDELPMDDRYTYVVVVTYNHALDEEITASVLKRPYRYLGVIGSVRKREVFRKRLEAAGFTKEQVQTMRTPVGLDIEAETPAEIAVSIVAELIAVRRRGQTVE